jgi:predicted TIM-barrel fold metal-dependent hydrolase
MVGVVLGGNGLNKPFGHPAYHPIYEAASDLGLPVVIQAGPEMAADAVPQLVAGGDPSTYAEWSALSWETQAAHMTSLIAQGVFQVFPKLWVLFVGAGVFWIPAHLARMDMFARMMPRDAPWLDRLPSEYFAEFFRMATYSMELPPGDRQQDLLARIFAAYPEFQDVLVYASGYCNADWDRPQRWERLLPNEWHKAVLERNALESLFRWPDESPSEP